MSDNCGSKPQQAALISTACDISGQIFTDFHTRKRLCTHSARAPPECANPPVYGRCAYVRVAMPPRFRVGPAVVNIGAMQNEMMEKAVSFAESSLRDCMKESEMATMIRLGLSASYPDKTWQVRSAARAPAAPLARTSTDTAPPHPRTRCLWAEISARSLRTRTSTTFTSTSGKWALSFLRNTCADPLCGLGVAIPGTLRRGNGGGGPLRILLLLWRCAFPCSPCARATKTSLLSVERADAIFI